MKDFALTEKELEIADAEDWGQYSDKEIADFARKEHERLMYMKSGEFEAECRKRQASIALRIIKQLNEDCARLEKSVNKNADKIEAGRLRSKFETMAYDLQSGFTRLGEIAGWWKKK
ncbi:MAG: hypothetical protein J6Q22_08800 [Prevotella sp.]|nr:hypothetical protein [Prevotella sp.]